MKPQVGDRVVYRGRESFGLQRWQVHRKVVPGDLGVVVALEELPEIPGLDNGQRWVVDFGDGRTVTIRGFDGMYGKADGGREGS